MGKTAETVIVLSFAYFSQFPPQFSPCENCALIVQTTLWHFSSLVPPLPLQNKFFYLHYARSSIHSCGNFRCSLIRVLLAVSAAVFAAKTAHSLFKQRYGIISALVPPPLTEQVFYLHYVCTSIHSCGNFRCSLIRISLAVSAAVFALRKLPNCSFKQRYGILYPLFRPSLQNKFFHLHYICTSIHSG